MARERSYGWSPEQMARINARREARGKDPYIDKNMRYEDYAGRYESAGQKYSPQNQISTQAPQKSLRERRLEKGSMKDEARARTEEFSKRFNPKVSMKDEAKARTEEFSKRFNPKGSMRIESAVESEAEKLKRKRGIGISTPSIQGSYNRFTA